jgi:hypothetical protein
MKNGCGYSSEQWGVGAFFQKEPTPFDKPLGHFPANLGICQVNFPLCLIKLIPAAMQVMVKSGSMSEHIQFLTTAASDKGID